METLVLPPPQAAAALPRLPPLRPEVQMQLLAAALPQQAPFGAARGRGGRGRGRSGRGRGSQPASTAAKQAPEAATAMAFGAPVRDLAPAPCRSLAGRRRRRSSVGRRRLSHLTTALAPRLRLWHKQPPPVASVLVRRGQPPEGGPVVAAAAGHGKDHICVGHRVARRVSGRADAPRKVKCPREVQVCMHALDRAGGYVRSITARDHAMVPELRGRLDDLKVRSKVMSYACVVAELKVLRAQYVNKGVQAERNARMKAAGRGLFKRRPLSRQLAAVVGDKAASMTEVMKAVWKYIHEHKLLSGRVIEPDKKLALVTQPGPFDLFELASLLKPHLQQAS